MAAKKKTGRPSSFTDKVNEEILERVANGESVAQIGRDPHLPDASNIRREIKRNSEFRTRYEAAKQEMAEMMADEMRVIADDDTGDTQRDRLRIDTRKWLMSKLLPKKYGDKLDIEANHTGTIKVTIGGDV